MTKDKKLLLIDGHSVAFRAFFGLHSQIESMKNKNGLHTNALYGFHNMLEKVVETENPTHALVAFDAGKTTFRHEYFEEYKGGRDSMPGEFSEQIPYLKDLIQGFGIETYELENYEADDIIGTLAKEAEAKGINVVIITGDRDLTQLASPSTRVDITKKGVSDLKEYTPESIKEEMGITPEQVVDMKGLAGDNSDNIPGVTRIGDKTALKLLKEYNTVEELYENIDGMKKSKRKENLINEKETALLSKKLATIDRDSPITISVDTLEYDGKNVEELIAFYKEMNFNSHLEKLDTSAYMDSVEEDMEKVDYTFVKTVTSDMFRDNMAIYAEMLDDNYHYADIELISWGNDEKIYVAAPETLTESDEFKNWAKDETKSKTVFDSKGLFVSLYHRGVELNQIDFDVSLASYLLTAEDTSSADVADVAEKHGYTNVLADQFVYGKGKKKGLPEDLEKMNEHLASKVKAIYSLKSKLQDELAENEQGKLLMEMELPLARVLAEMEIAGITVDVDRIKQMKDEFEEQLNTIEKRIYEEAGEEFNINSPKQLGKILFEKLEYPVIRKTKTGYSTAQDVLEKLRSQAPIADYILTYRTISKIQSTYVEGLLKVIEENTDKVHTRYLQTVARTGRLSSVDPNLQNIPVRIEEGRKIRQAFIPNKKGWKIFGADYSQIELRILAHISEDEELIRTFKNDEDVHTTTAMKVFDIDDASEVTADMRREAKAVNFGIVYGISDYGLSQSLDISRKEAKEYIDTYFDRFPGVKDYIDSIIREGKDKEYVETLFNRRRYLPEINSRNFNRRSFAERTAMNTPIQGSAADILKMAMIEMSKRLEEEGFEARMLLQVHDELIFEVSEEELPKLKELVGEVMENTVKLSIPLKVDYGSGDSWYEV